MSTDQRKQVLVLGGSSGIGKSIAQRFACEGWCVIIASNDSENAALACSELPGEGHCWFAVDVRYDEQIDHLVGLLKAGQARVDVLINSVGISESFKVLDTDFAGWNNVLEVMLYGTVKTCRALVPFIPEGGRIIHITSIHHRRVEKGQSAYGMAKAAITQFTRSLALELAPQKILANTIAPGFIDTAMSVKQNGINELTTEWFHDNYIKYDHLPLKRAGRPEEVAGVAFFLAGPDATYITGSVITVDGGLTITF
ncbi:MAG: SDR family oxidoreductase [Chitinophagaceae bacterium]|nr:SDR family oxidoreductase [Chitinophagaceae bacterium]